MLSLWLPPSPSQSHEADADPHTALGDYVYIDGGEIIQLENGVLSGRGTGQGTTRYHTGSQR